MKQQTYAIILCGGSGSRLWPRSRSTHPKHLLQLNGGATLVQETIKRIDLPLDHIYCITEASHAELLQQQVEGIPAENIVIEPDRRGTASAVGLAVAVIAQRVPGDAVILSLHADSLIPDRDEFSKTMQAWVAAIRETNRIINLGIKPSYPSTGLGYINLGRKLTAVGDFDVFVTASFVEKPNEPTARMYVESGRYLWNSGMFGATVATLQAEMTTHMTEWQSGLTEIAAAVSGGDTARANKRYLALPDEAIDVALLEKSQRLAVIPASFAWSDVGSWADLHDVLEHDDDDNVFDGEYVDIDSRNCFIYSPKQLVATIGLENLVIINTDDAVLICPKDRTQDVKKVVKKLKETGKTHYL